MSRGSAPIVDRNAAETELLTRLRLSVMRLARRLRQESTGDDQVTPSILSALASVARLGPVTLGDLAAAERVQPPSMTRLVSRMEELDLVEREQDAGDRRVVRVRLTSSGRHFVDRTRTKKNEYLARRMAGLTPEEARLLEQALPVLERLVGDEA